MWQFLVDCGSTFTDIVAHRPDGVLRSHKLLSENPEQYKDAAVHGIRKLLGIGLEQEKPTGIIDAVKMGTTVATNAHLTSFFRKVNTHKFSKSVWSNLRERYPC